MSGFNTKRRFVISARNAKDAANALSKKKMVAGNGEGLQPASSRRRTLRNRSSLSWMVIYGVCSLIKEGRIGQSFVVPMAQSNSMAIWHWGSSPDHRIPMSSNVASIMPRDACTSTSRSRCAVSMEHRNGEYNPIT